MEKILTFLVEYYNHNTNKAQQAAILKYLKQFPLDMIQKASNEIVNNETFFPLISTWKKYLEISDKQKAEKAYLLACEAARKGGIYTPVEFEDKTIHAVIQSLGGWHHFCCSETDPQWRHKNFIDAYLSHAGSETFDNVPALLTTGETFKTSKPLFFTNCGACKVKQIEAKKNDSIFKQIEERLKVDD